MFGWFLENDTLNAEKSQIISYGKRALCKNIGKYQDLKGIFFFFSKLLIFVKHNILKF